MPILIGGLVILALAGYLLLFYRSVFILVYHGVAHDFSAIPGLIIHPEAFRRQMRLLAALGFHSRTIDTVVEDLLAGDSGRTRTLSITFDDGYRSICEHALPVLKEMSWRATVFVPTDEIGGRNKWDEGRGFASLPLLNWKDLEILADQGISVGSHGKTHRSLIRMSESDCMRELRESLAILQSRLPNCSRVFSYPYGHRNSELATLARQAGYVGACSVVSGAFPGKNQRYDLGRLMVRSNSLPLFLFALLRYPVVSLARNLWRRLQG